MDNSKLAENILSSVGGKENVDNVIHCATRLRFNLKDEEIAKTEKLKKTEGVIAVVQSGGQYQIVIGNTVPKVYAELSKILGNVKESKKTIENSSVNKEKKAPKKGSFFGNIIDIVSAIFTPFLGVMAGAGVLKGFLALATHNNMLLDPSSGTFQILNVIGDAIFYFLPIFIAITAAEKFKARKFVSITIALTLLHPGMGALLGNATGGTLLGQSVATNFLGIPILGAPYASSVIPIIMAVFLQSYIEKFLEKVIPDVIKNIILPIVSIIIMVPLVLIFLGPLGIFLGSFLASLYLGAYNLSPILAGIILGAFWQVFVMFGAHWAFIPIMINNFTAPPIGLGYDTMGPMILPAVLAQVGAALGVALKTKNMKLRSLAASTSLTGLFGITEPAIYGVTLKLKKPFIYACIGGAVGGGVMGLYQIKTFAMAMPSVLTILTYIKPSHITDPSITSSATIGAIAGLIAIVVAFLLTYILGFKDLEKEENE